MQAFQDSVNVIVKMTLFLINAGVFFFFQNEKNVVSFFILLNPNEITKTTRQFLKKASLLRANQIALIASYFKKNFQQKM